MSDEGISSGVPHHGGSEQAPRPRHGLRNRRRHAPAQWIDCSSEGCWLRGGDLNPRPLGYEPNELPDCSTPRHGRD